MFLGCSKCRGEGGGAHAQASGVGGCHHTCHRAISACGQSDSSVCIGYSASSNRSGEKVCASACNRVGGNRCIVGPIDCAGVSGCSPVYLDVVAGNRDSGYSKARWSSSPEAKKVKREKRGE